MSEQSFVEHRRERRQPFVGNAWVKIGDQRAPVDILEISEAGARILTATPHNWPSRFHLVFTENGSVARDCKVVWRGNGTIGVEFLAAPMRLTPADLMMLAFG